MTELGHSNISEGDYKDFEKSGDEFILEEAWPVCPKCFKPCHPLQNYCDNCDSNEAMNPLASYMPFVRIRFHAGMFGKLWRKTWYDKETSLLRMLFFLFIIIVGAPFLLVIGSPLLLISKIKNPLLRTTSTIGFITLLFVLWIIYISYLL